MPLWRRPPSLLQETQSPFSQAQVEAATARQAPLQTAAQPPPLSPLWPEPQEAEMVATRQAKLVVVKPQQQ
jgi:hypothetical protein